MKRFKSGMYEGDESSSFSLPSKDKKYINVTLPDGQQLVIVAPQYVDHLEQQILDTNRKLAIQNDKNIAQDNEMKRLRAAIKKLESRLS